MKPRVVAGFLASLAVWAVANRDTTALAEKHSNKIIPIEGHYVRPGTVASADRADLDVSVIAAGRISVSGVALWGKNLPGGPNFGELEFQAAVENGQAAYEEKSDKSDNGLYRLTLRFRPQGLTAVEQGHCEDCGLGVNFSGNYRRVSSLPATGKP